MGRNRHGAAIPGHPTSSTSPTYFVDRNLELGSGDRTALITAAGAHDATPSWPH